MANVPGDLVLRSVEHVVQGHCELDHPQRRAQVPCMPTMLACRLPLSASLFPVSLQDSLLDAPAGQQISGGRCKQVAQEAAKARPLLSYAKV